MVKQEFKADVSDAERNLEKLRKDMIKLQEEMAKTAQVSNDAEKKHQQEVQKGLRLQQQLIAQTETLTEKKKRMQDSIKTAYDAGRMSADEYEQALQNIDKATQEVTEAEKRHQEEVRKGVLLHQRFSAQTETLTQKKQRMQKQLEAAWQAGAIDSTQYANSLLKVQQETSDLEGENQKLGTSTKGVFNSQMVASIASVSVAVGALTTAYNFATEALRKFKEERERGAGETESLQDSRRRLAQVSRGDLDEMITRVDNAAIATGVDRQTATNVMFRARSEGFEQDYEKVLAMDPVISAEGAANIAGKTRMLFDKENLTVDSAVSGFLSAAETSDASVDDLARVAPGAAEGGRQQGAKFSETISMLSVLSPMFKSADTAADRMKGFASKMALNDQTKGKGFIGGFEALQAMSEEERADFLGGNDELNQIYAALTDAMPKVKEVTARTEEAMTQNLAQQRLDEINANPILANQLRANRAKIARDVSAETMFSSLENKNKATIDQANVGINYGSKVGSQLAGGGLMGSTSYWMAGLAVNKAMTTADSYGVDLQSATTAAGTSLDVLESTSGLEELRDIMGVSVEVQQQALEIQRRRGGGGVRSQGRSQEGLGGVDR